MAEIDKYEAMEVRTRAQEEQLALIKKKKKRNYIVGLSLTGVGVLGLIAVYLLAAFVWLVDLTTLPYIEYSYSAEGGEKVATLEKVKADSNYPAEFRIPAVVNGLKVTEIGKNAFVGCDRLEKVIMTDNITTIGDFAFTDCENLKEIVFSNSITRLGTGCFDGTAFFDNLSDTKPEILGSILFKIGPNEVKPNSILLTNRDSEVPAKYATGYNKVYISDWEEETHITTWAEGLFKGNENIVYVEIPDYLVEIPNRIFMNCPNLEEVKFSSAVTAIEEEAFMNTPKLATATLSENITSIEENAFNGSGLVTQDLPEKLTYVGDGAFQNCTKLKSIDWDINANVPAYAFKGCKELSNFTFSNDAYKTIKSVGKNAFEGTKLEKFDFPINTSIIYQGTFKDVHTLKTLSIFEGNKYVTNEGKIVTQGVGKIEQEAFRNTALETIKLVDKDGQDIPGKTTGVNLPFTVTTLNESLADGYTFAGGLDKDGNYHSPLFTSFTFPSGTREVPYGMFEGNKNIKEIHFGSYHMDNEEFSVSKIHNKAFKDCISITEMVIPDMTMFIGEFAFAGMKSLKTIHLPDGTIGSGENLFKLISKGLFDGDSALQEVNLHEKITKIGTRAFAGNHSLEYVYLPVPASNVRSLTIENNAFTEARDRGENNDIVLTEEQKMPIYVNFTREDIKNHAYIIDPFYKKDGETNESRRIGFYDPNTCHVYYSGQWEMQGGIPTPVKGGN